MMEKESNMISEEVKKLAEIQKKQELHRKQLKSSGTRQRPENTVHIG